MFWEKLDVKISARPLMKSTHDQCLGLGVALVLHKELFNCFIDFAEMLWAAAALVSPCVVLAAAIRIAIARLG